MIKYLFILINSLSLFIYSLLSGDGGITIANNIPKNMAPGQEVPIELKVAKGNMSGFAKLQLDLPTGFTVKEVDNKGSNFSFTDGIAKWVWSSLPTEEEIIVKFILIPDAGSSGAKTIGGKYSYVENNGKKVVEMDPVEVTIGEGAAAANTQTTSPSTNTDVPANTNTAAANEQTTSTQPTVTPQPNTNSEPTGDITVQRTITKSGEGEYQVNLKIKKGMTKGFARYSDDLPSDLNAKAVKTEDASFSVSDGKIKFVWVAVPEKDELELAYTISGINKPLVLNGEYSYLEQNQSKSFLVPAETITPESTTTAANTNTETAANTNTTATEQNTNTAATNTETAANTNTTAATQNTEAAVTNTETPQTLPKKEGNINYMVQIGAFTSSAVNPARLTKKFNISENIKSEMQGGFSKFMVGDHPEYKKARDHREKMRNNNKVATAFVVAYNTGKRITVQEALMISNQKWFK